MRFLAPNKARAKRQLIARLGGAEPPSFPTLTLQILEKLRSPEVEFAEVADAIRWDPGLTVKLLGIVNSSAYAPKREIRDVRHAMTYIGGAQLESVVLAVTASSAVTATATRGFNPVRFWRAAAQRATLARAFAGHLHPAQEGESFTAALLLDLAIPIMSATFGEAYSDVLEEWHASPGVSLVDIERDHIERTHVEIGGLLAESWELPSTLTQAIQHHHDSAPGEPTSSSDGVLPAIRLVAGIREVAPEHALEQLIEMARTEYGIDPDWTRETIDRSAPDASALARQLARRV